MRLFQTLSHSTDRMNVAEPDPALRSDSGSDDGAVLAGVKASKTGPSSSNNDLRRESLSIPIEDYAMIGDCHTAGLVSKQGSIDWLCLPHFDSGACFAALLGTAEHGYWSISPAEPIRSIRRHYRDGTLILETEFETESGSVKLIDCMAPRSQVPELLRVVVGIRGQVRMKMELVMRFDYGSVVPWVRRIEGGISAIAGPDMIRLHSDVELLGENMKTGADFTVAKGQKVSFNLTWYP